MAETFELYLIRHGVAEDAGEAWPDDTKRPLTHKGAARVRQEAAGLDRLGVGFDQILTSPLVRARQTAELLAGSLEPHPPLAVAAALAPEGSIAQVLEELARHVRRPRIALVGHEPGLGTLAAKLLGLRGAVAFKKGAVCRIDVESLPPTRPGTLRWMATPRMLRALGK